MAYADDIVARLAIDEIEKVVDHKYICAIDFGSATTGYSFVNRDDKDKVIRCQEWDEGLCKTETAVVLDEDGAVKWFGTEATRKYAALTAKREHCNYLYFSRFKMVLLETESKRLSLDLKISAADGQKMRVWKVISKMFIYLRDHFIKRIKRATKYSLQPDQVLWVLTVPAIWGNGAKQLMRHAAQQAGLCSEEEPQRLKIVLEPEAAGIFCTNLDLSAFVDDDKEHAVFSSEADPEEAAEMVLQPGNKLLVVDCGGGTVDISVLEKMADNSFQVCAEPNGGPWGGNVVNDGVWEVIADVVGRETVKEWRLEYLESFVELQTTIENKKKAWDGDEESSIAFNLPASLLESLHDERIDLKERVRKTARRTGHQIECSKYNIIFGSSLMESIFDKSIQPIKRRIERMATQGLLRGVVVALIVGGFANSCVLQRQVAHHIKTLDGSIDVLVPLESSASIVKGAVRQTRLWTCDRPVVNSRVSEKTYGIALSKPANPDRHEGRERFMSYAENDCGDLFYTMIARGETVDVGHEVRKSLTYLEPCEKTNIAETYLYSSREESVEFTDDPGCELEAVITTDLTPPSKDKRTKSTLFLVFGETEIKAVVVDVVSKRATEKKVNFLYK